MKRQRKLRGMSFPHIYVLWLVYSASHWVTSSAWVLLAILCYAGLYLTGPRRWPQVRIRTGRDHVAIAWQRRDAKPPVPLRRTVQTACTHPGAEPVELKSGERVAWVCPDCPAELPRDFLPPGHEAGQERVTDDVREFTPAWADPFERSGRPYLAERVGETARVPEIWLVTYSACDCGECE